MQNKLKTHALKEAVGDLHVLRLPLDAARTRELRCGPGQQVQHLLVISRNLLRAPRLLRPLA